MRCICSALQYLTYSLSYPSFFLTASISFLLPFPSPTDLQKEREERIKQIKERQNEERQRKLEELKAQALAAQKFREQKEEERRRRMEDLRRRENDRRSQVEERRRAIQEADNERRQYILQKNQERDQRMETKRRNERSSIQFAFGSSTPRMIDTTDSGMCSSFWANRRWVADSRWSSGSGFNHFFLVSEQHPSRMWRTRGYH